MKKGSYFIAISEKGKKYKASVDGYIFEISGIKFGVTNNGRNGEKIYDWVITELTSGCLVGRCNKKADAVNSAAPLVEKLLTIWKRPNQERFLVESLPTI